MKDEKKPKSRTFYRMGFCLLLAVVFLTVSLQTAAREKSVFTGNSRLFNHYGDDNGLYIKEMEKTSIDIFQTYEDELEVYGYQVINGKYSKLPIGSTLDKNKGIFYWLPGPGFIGEYEFVFKSAKLGEEKKIKIFISPKIGELHSSKVKKDISRVSSSEQPFGSFDTPIDGSTVRSSIAVTGWALDDTGIKNVKIYRGETWGLVYIGDAMLVEGARPDVAAAYPNYPNNTKAGWGYMMLTNFLPNSDNGTFKIHAIATDWEGKSTTLGIKTIHVDNANAVKPFGAIDTPTQGGTASGSSFINWGWVLTPQPKSIPTDGSTINVYIDGVNLGHPIYNIYRSDIAALFPGYANSYGAAGYFYLDTTAYEMGVHTIQWTASDSGGNSDGIGSKYFLINFLGIEWIDIPAGEFQMGDNFNEGNDDELPVHTVYLSAYKISKYGVTFEQYDAFCDDIGRSKPSDSGMGRGNRPVMHVSWFDAKAFCDWMSQKTGKNIHLPTEAQWEKAARGTDQRRYPWGNSSPSCSLANYYGCGGQTKPVDSHPSGVSFYGVHDMAGNVWEWCNDWYSSTYYYISPYENPTGPSSGTDRVERGGCFYCSASTLRSANRYKFNPSMDYWNLGFRLAQD